METQVAPKIDLQARTERVCFALMQSEIDLAFSLLRLAEAEIRGGDDAHVRELVGRASTMYKVALSYLDVLPVCGQARVSLRRERTL